MSSGRTSTTSTRSSSSPARRWAGEAHLAASTDLPATDAAAPAQLADYALIRELGRGGMGVVYLARQAGLNRLVCVKLLLSGPWAGEAEVQRFLREAEAAASLRHPNIVGIHELGQADGRHFFAMEYVEGRTLAELVRDGPLPAERAAGYVREIAEAVEHAHRQGVLHRDLKPSNVLIDAEDRPRITDFGLARRLDAPPGGSLTTTGAIVGTPAYMPPEQSAPASGAIGPRSDVYAMGAVLYELITGRPPFRGETPLDTLMQVRTIEPVRPGLLNPRVSADLETICLKCLEKDPARRYESARAWPTTWTGSWTAGRSRRGRSARRARPGDGAGGIRSSPWSALTFLGFAALAAASAIVTYSAYRAESKALAARDAALKQVSRALADRDAALKDVSNALAIRDGALEGSNGHLYVSRFQRAWQSWQSADMAGLDRLLEELRPARARSTAAAGSGRSSAAWATRSGGRSQATPGRCSPRHGAPTATAWPPPARIGSSWSGTSAAAGRPRRSPITRGPCIPSPGAATAAGSPPAAKTGASGSGTWRTTGCCTSSATSPASSGRWPGTPTAAAWPGPAMRGSSSGTARSDVPPGRCPAHRRRRPRWPGAPTAAAWPGPAMKAGYSIATADAGGGAMPGPRGALAEAACRLGQCRGLEPEGETGRLGRPGRQPSRSGTPPRQRADVSLDRRRARP